MKQSLEFVFQPSNQQQEFKVNITLVDDEINELNEGFWLVIELDPSNTETAILDRNGLALVTIRDNDRKNNSLANEPFEPNWRFL